MEGLAGRVAVITGANSGIGRGIAFKLAAMGAKVVINGRDPGKGEAVRSFQLTRIWVLLAPQKNTL